MARKLVFTLCIVILATFTSHAEAGTLTKPTNNLGLIGYWSFNEGTSTIAHDFSGRGKNGTMAGFAAPATVTSGWGAGKLGSGLNFDGSNDEITILDSFVPTAYTYSMWIKPATISQQGYFCLTSVNTCGTDYTHAIGLNSDGTITHTTWDGAYQSVTGTTALVAGRWYHIVITAANGGFARLYINGVEEGSPDSVGTLWPDGDRYEIGTNGDLGYNQANGAIDEVRAYSRQFTAAEVRGLYQSGSAKINSTPKNIVTSGLVGHWTFDGGGVTDKVYDASSQGSNGYFVNGATSTAKGIGKIGQSLNFDGVDDYIRVSDPSNNSLDFGTATDFTVSAWVNSSTADGHDGIVVKHDQSVNSGFQVSMENGSSLSVAIPSVAANCKITNAVDPSDGKWKLITVVFYRRASCTLSDILLYINGELDTTTTLDTADGNTNIDISNSDELIIGARKGGGTVNDFWPGKIDDVRIYNRALSAQEIRNLYGLGGSKVNVSHANPPGTTLGSGLVGYWSFNGLDIIDRVYDRSGNGNNGYFINGATSTAKKIGKSGQGLSFIGSSQQYMYVPVDASLTPSLVSVSLWFKASPGQGGFMIEHGKISWTAFHMSLDEVDGYIYSHIGTNAGNADGPTATSNVGFNDGKWHLAIITYDQTTLSLYVDGVLEDSSASENGPIVYEDSEGNNYQTHIGSHVWLSNVEYNYTGLLDEVRIYNRVLSASEAKQLYLLDK